MSAQRIRSMVDQMLAEEEGLEAPEPPRNRCFGPRSRGKLGSVKLEKTKKRPGHFKFKFKHGRNGDSGA